MTTGFQLNLSRTHDYICNREPLTLYNRQGAQVCRVQDGKRLPQNLRESEVSDGDYVATNIGLRLPASQVTGAISPGWSILDAASLAYVVLAADTPGTYSADWRCTCRRVDVLGLFNAVDWRQVVQGTDEYADRVSDPSNFTLKGHYPARIQPASADDMDILGKRGFINTSLCYVLPDLDLTYGDLIVDTANGNQNYKVVGWASKQNLASALTIFLETLP